jgi:hypothetical protein
VERLSNSYEINAIIGEIWLFSLKYFVPNVLPWLCIFDLLFAGIAGYYLIKIFRKYYCRLAVASCAIPCQFSPKY